MTRHLRAARKYAKLGIGVFPLAEGEKVPVAGSRGFHDATTDTEQIRWWWNENRWFNVGLRPPEGVIVLDVDPRNGGSLDALRGPNGKIRRTLIARTGSGGFHLWYRFDGPTRGKLSTGLDIKTHHNGYVVAPPSVHPNGTRYEWRIVAPIAPLPPWLVESVSPPPPTPRKPAAGRTARRLNMQLLGWVMGGPEGDRNNRLFGVACRAFEDGADINDVVRAGEEAGLSSVEIDRTIESARRKVSAR